MGVPQFKKKENKMVNVQRIGKPMSLDNKPIFDKQITVPITAKISNRATLMMHTEFGKGNCEGHDFRVIQDIGGRALRIDFKHLTIDIGTQDLLQAVLKEVVKQEFVVPAKKKGKNEKTK